MTCSDVREYLFAFLDSELDAPLSIELQRHIERCHHCAREIEIERAVRRRLERDLVGDVAGVGDDEPPLQRAVAKATSSQGARSRWSRRATLAAAVAAAFLVTPAVWLVLRHDRVEHHRDGFADLVVTDFQHFVAAGKAVQIVSSDRRTVSAWLRDATQLDVRLPDSLAADRELIGARKCTIGGRPAAFVVYDMNGVTASLIVAVKRDQLAQMEPVRQGRRIHWVDRCRGHTVVARSRGNLVYAAVAKLPEADLLELMTDTANEGD